VLRIQTLLIWLAGVGYRTIGWNVEHSHVGMWLGKAQRYTYKAAGWLVRCGSGQYENNAKHPSVLDSQQVHEWGRICARARGRRTTPCDARHS
jgi:hypothetical protein